MNEKQWYASAVVFLIFALVSGFVQNSYGRFVTATNFDTLFLVSQVYAALAVVFLAAFFVCLACGRLEKNTYSKRLLKRK